MNPKLATALLLPAIVATGCGASHKSTAPTTKQSTTRTEAVAVASAATLAASARNALQQNYRLSVYVLWNNEIPPWAQQSTSGPALRSLGSAAAKRRARGIRIRMLLSRRVIVSFALDPSYTTATAIVVADERVQPSNRSGHPLGRALELRERGKFILHRAGRSRRFIVWLVVQLR